MFLKQIRLFTKLSVLFLFEILFEIKELLLIWKWSHLFLFESHLFLEMSALFQKILFYFHVYRNFFYQWTCVFTFYFSCFYSFRGLLLKFSFSYHFCSSYFHFCYCFFYWYYCLPLYTLTFYAMASWQNSWPLSLQNLPQNLHAKTILPTYSTPAMSYSVCYSLGGFIVII